ncbi:prepilin peptidase [Candidatus Woesearchaeota archaeon]|nr:prepilin peptidase [Candidatus Woesearchaeota archaeon]
MLFWYFLIIVAIIWILFATITDIKKREVPDWLNYSLIVIGLGIRAIYSLITKDFSYILFGLIGFIACFVFANLMYYTKQWGGGDSKLLMGLGAMFGNYNLDIFDAVHKLPFIATLIINIFIAGTVYGIIYSLFLGAKNHINVLAEIKKRKFNELKIISLIILALIIIIFFIFERDIFYLIALLLIASLFAVFLLYLIKIIEDVSLYKFIQTNKLTEGDWLVNDIIKNNKIICKARNIGLTRQDILNLKKNKIKKVLIKEGIPFVPGFLFGFILTIVFGDLLFLFI